MNSLKIRFVFIILVFQVVTARYPIENYDDESIETDNSDEDDGYGYKTKSANHYGYDSNEEGDEDYDDVSIEVDNDYRENPGYRSKYKKTYYSFNSNDEKNSRSKESQSNDDDDESSPKKCRGGMVNCPSRNNRPQGGGNNRGNNNRQGGGNNRGNNNRQGGGNYRRNNNRQGGMNNRGKNNNQGRDNRRGINNNKGRGNRRGSNNNKGRGEGSGMQKGSCNRCGIGYGEAGSGRVVNGKEVKPVYKYPWIVHLISGNVISCGGALISATWVMTAGHCVFNKEMLQYPQCQQHGAPSFCYHDASIFRVGILSENQRTPSETVAVSQIIGHPKYYYPELMHDISLMKLASPVQCSASTMPVCLPKKDLHRLGQPLITAGYGWNTPEGIVGPQILREGSVKEVDPRRCKRQNQPSDFYNYLVCAAGMETGQSSCYGDSGSSVFGKFGSKFIAVGVVSYGSKPQCTGQNPVAYHRVFTAMDFIKQNVKDLPEG